ncbi:MAG: hypothetical protein WAS21_23735 [Geminicoccaceae bacterium]
MRAKLLGWALLAGMLPLAGCGGGDPPVVQVSGGLGGGGIQAQTIEEQLVNMQSQITALQQEVGALRAKAGQ